MAISSGCRRSSRLLSLCSHRMNATKQWKTVAHLFLHTADKCVKPGVPQVARLWPPTDNNICRDWDFCIHFSAWSYDEVFHESEFLYLCIKSITPLSSKIFLCEVSQHPWPNCGCPRTWGGIASKGWKILKPWVVWRGILWGCLAKLEFALKEILCVILSSPT